MGIIKRNIDSLDRLLRDPSVDKYITPLEQKTGLQRKYVGAGIIAVIAFALVIGYRNFFKNYQKLES